MSDAAWLKSYAAQRDAEAFALIVARYEGMVFATCRRRLRDAADVEDAVQETFLRLARKAGELREALGGWLHRCAVNVATDLNRRRASRVKREKVAARPQGAVDPPAESQGMLAELRGQLDAAMEKLDPAARELIVQRYFVGRSQAELAAEAGLAPSTLAHRLQQAVDALRRQLQAKAGGMAVVIAAGVLIGALEAETAAASVPAILTANVMKIGLTGVGPAARGVFRAAGLKALAGIAAMAVLAIGWWWFWGSNPRRAPPAAPAAQVTPASGMPEVVANSQISPGAAESQGALANNRAPVTVEVDVSSAEAVPLMDVIPQLIDDAGRQIAPLQKGFPARFVVLPGHYRAQVERENGQWQIWDVNVGTQSTAAGQVEVVVLLLR